MMRPQQEAEPCAYVAYGRRHGDAHATDDQRLHSHARLTDLVHAVLVVAFMIFIVVFAGSYAR